MQIVTHKTKTLELTDTVATRSFPFTQRTLDQLRELRVDKQEEILEETGEEVTVPAPIIIAEAIDEYHKQIFGEVMQ